MSSCFVTRAIPEIGIEVLRAAGVEFEVGQADDASGLDRDALLAGCRRHSVVVCQLTESIDAALLEQCPELRGVANVAVGFDNIDVKAATELGIPVSNTPGVLTDATADLCWALLLAVARRIPEAHAYAVAGDFRIWRPNLLLGADVGSGEDGQRKTLGIIGLGRIGRAVARRAAGFDMEVIAYGRDREAIEQVEGVTYAGLDGLLARSDFVTLHVPLSEATHHLIDARALSLMQRSAFLINTARGAIVDEAALVAALREREIAGAGLDVYEDEPNFAPGLADLPNVVLLPHIGSATRSTRGAMAEIACSNAVQHLRGKPARNALNPEVYDSGEWRARFGAA